MNKDICNECGEEFQNYPRQNYAVCPDCRRWDDEMMLSEDNDPMMHQY